MPLGNPEAYGLLGPADQSMGLLNMDPRQMALLSAAASLLEGGGPSLTPTSLGQNLGRALNAGMGSYQMGRQQALQNALMKRQMARSDRDEGRANRALDLQEQRLQSGVDDPSAVREWQFYSALSPEQQKQYLEMKRALQLAQIGGVQNVVRPGGEVQPLSTLDQEAAAKEELAAASTRGQESAKATVNAASELSKIEEREAQVLRILDDPNFDAAVGPIDQFSGRLGEAMGTEQGVLGGEIERLSNALVREAAATWKGAISEKELELFMRSVPRRGNSGATWRSWYQNEYLPMKAKVQEKAGGPSPESQVLRYNPATGRVE